jgi:hypothetical protein
VSELQRGPDISVEYEVWRRIEWSDGDVQDWHPIDAEYSTVEAARERTATLPTLIPSCMHGPTGTAEYRIRQAITILEWLE